MLHSKTTGRLFLREPRLSDVQDFFDMFSDAETCRMDGGYPPYSRPEDALADLRALVEDGANRLFIEDRQTGRMIGLLHVMPGEQPDGVQIGYAIHRAFRRRGYAREAIRALLDMLRESGVHSVLATCYAMNDASAALLQSLGFAESDRMTDEKNPSFSECRFVLTLGHGGRT